MSLNIELIRSSFEKAAPMGDAIADTFYHFLFQDYPQVRSLFKDEKMVSQKKDLVTSLVYIVTNLENEEKLIPYLENMGSRHANYGVEEGHYPLVGATLLKTFAHLFGPEWNHQLEQAWSDAYGVIAKVMLQGREEEAPEIQDIKSKAKDISEKILLEMLDEQLDKKFRELVQAKVRKVLMETLQEESEKLLKRAA